MVSDPWRSLTPWSGDQLVRPFRYSDQCVGRTAGHESGVIAVSTNNQRPTGNSIFSHIGDVEIILWDVSGRPALGDEVGLPIGSVSILHARGGDYFVTTSAAGRARVWTEDGTPVAADWQPAGAIAGLSPDGAVVVALEGCVVTFHGPDGAVISTGSLHLPELSDRACSNVPEREFVFSPPQAGQSRTATSTDGGDLYSVVWDVETGAHLTNGDFRLSVFESCCEAPNGAEYNADGSRLVWGTDNATMVIIEIDSEIGPTDATKLPVAADRIGGFVWLDEATLAVAGASGVSIVSADDGGHW